MVKTSAGKEAGGKGWAGRGEDAEEGGTGRGGMGEEKTNKNKQVANVVQGSAGYLVFQILSSSMKKTHL